jgi:hypothetical protein
MRINREFDSNEIVESDLQFEKHFKPRISTLLGIKIDWSDEDENANDSIRVKREFNSKKMNGTCSYSWRQTIEFGIQAWIMWELFSEENERMSIKPLRTIIRRW